MRIGVGTQAVAPMLKIIQKFSKEVYCKPAKMILEKYISNLQSKELFEYNTTEISKKRIYANNYINFDEIQTIGFDLDYTLVTYTEELQSLIYNLAKNILINAYGFPIALQDCKFDPKFSIRGLTVDTKHGIICKLSHVKRVGQQFVFQGKTECAPKEIEFLYGENRHIPHEDLINMRPINDLFSMAEACLIADSIEVFQRRTLNSIKRSKTVTNGAQEGGQEEKQEEDAYVPASVIEDIALAIKDVHTSGILHNTITANLEKYIQPAPEVVEMLTTLNRAGKKLFLCTNSHFPYTDKVMKYITENTAWREYFDFIICSAHKPDFFSSKKPFREWNTETSHPSPYPVGSFEEDAVYMYGSVHALKRANVIGNEGVLYIGDNLYADLVEARRTHGWQTTCIISELEHELNVQNDEIFQALHKLRSLTRTMLTDLLYALEEDRRNSKTINLRAHEIALVREIENELKSINETMSASFNPNFGSIFRTTSGCPTIFAFDIRRYVDLYTSRVTNFLNYSPSHRFFPSHSIHMAHDIKV